MTWSHLQSNFPWSVLLLLGGGFAISDGAQVSGLSEWVGQQLEGLSSLPHPVLLFIILLIVSVLTEFTSNSGTVSLLTPILFSLSRRLDIHPLYVSFAAVIVSQYAFVLPTSNPSNAICFAAGELRIKDMATPGVILNFLCLIVLFVLHISYGQLIFNFSNYSYSNITIGDGGSELLF